MDPAAVRPLRDRLAQLASGRPNDDFEIEREMLDALEHAQPAVRLLMTNARAIFVGGPRGVTLPWHAVAAPVQSDRDLILVRLDRTALHRFRCNPDEDALTGGGVARRLAGARRV